MKSLGWVIILVFCFSLVAIAQEKKVEPASIKTYGVKINVPDLSKAYFLLSG
ncbi:MAG: hypothetical protein HC846_06855 [Blastocatellia bacterium]|nr:hypothetical protein [Blastocatellia bacterium]